MKFKDNLVKELSKDIEKNNKLFLIDEPTAGLHDHDINFLIELLIELKTKVTQYLYLNTTMVIRN